MQRNPFTPDGLPLVTDNVLMRTVVEYVHACSMLRGSRSPSVSTIRSELEEAIQLILRELSKRGIDVAPYSSPSSLLTV